MKVTKAFENFILSRRLLSLSVKTIKDYTEFVSPFVKYLGEDKEVDSIVQDDVNGYIGILLDKDIARATLSTYIRHVKIFLRYCDNEYEVSYAIDKIKVPKAPKKNVRVYSDDEIRTLFKETYADSDWLTARNRLIMALMLDSGLRQSEVCNLQRKNIYISERYMSVLGKGNKERIVPLGKTTIKYLKEYYKLCPYESEYVFLSRTGKEMNNNTVKLMVGKVAKRVPFELSSHKLRHNFATNYCLDQYKKKGQIDIYKLMALLGHEDIETTKRYLHMSMKIIAATENISHIDNINLG